MFVLLLVHLLIGIAILVTGDRLGRRAFVAAAVAPGATLAWAIVQWGDVVGGGDHGRPITEEVGWISSLDLELALRFDAFALVMTLLVSGIGFLVFVYAVGYFSHIQPGQARLAGLMALFAGAMLGVVWADHLIALFIAWELTSITSYLLIGNNDRSARARAAATQAILITGAGGLSLLFGLVILGENAGTYRLSELTEQPPSGGATAAALVLILGGAFTKSAQWPFGSWLPGAMVAPTPVSTYLHSATMVKAGVYLVARLAPIVATLGQWRVLVLAFGSVTMIVGGLRALRQHDLKLLLAYGTVSQLGFMMLLLGVGQEEIAHAGVVVLLAHGAFKATLFMLVGVIDHQVGTRDVRGLHGFGPAWRPVTVMAVLAAASMAGLPPLLGFVAKETALDGYLEHGDFVGAGAVLVVIVVGSMFTFAYSARYVLGVLGRLGVEGEERRSVDAPAPSSLFVSGAAVLTVVTVVVGIVPELASDLVAAATTSLDPEAHPHSLHLWSGFTAAAVLSLVVIAGGLLLTFGRVWVAKAQHVLAAPLRALPSTDEAYGSTIRGVDRFAAAVTRTVQTGSLPVSSAIILTFAVGVPLVPLLGGFDALPDWIENPLHIPLAIVIISAAIGAATVKRRMAAALMLGTVGFAMAGLYEVQGAPDLALTQFAIETLGTVLFVLVLRFLPSRFVDVAPAVLRSLRLAVAVFVGGAVFVVAIVASESRSDVAAPSISEEMIERAEPDGHGGNVVNVILVDFRGVDTMGEITVLVVAAVGAVAVARAGRRRDDDEQVLDADDVVDPTLTATDPFAATAAPPAADERPPDDRRGATITPSEVRW